MSSWDLAAPKVQLMVFLLAFTAGSEQIRFTLADQLAGFWPKTFSGLVIIAATVMLSTWINRSLRSIAQRSL